MILASCELILLQFLLAHIMSFHCRRSKEVYIGNLKFLITSVSRDFEDLLMLMLDVRDADEYLRKVIIFYVVGVGVMEGYFHPVQC